MGDEEVELRELYNQTLAAYESVRYKFSYTQNYAGLGTMLPYPFMGMSRKELEKILSQAVALILKYGTAT